TALPNLLALVPSAGIAGNHLARTQKPSARAGSARSTLRFSFLRSFRSSFCVIHYYTHLTEAIIVHRLVDLFAGVHHKRSIPRYGLVQRQATNEQYLECDLRVRPILDPQIIAVLCEQDHLPVNSSLAFGAKQT